MNLVNFDWHKSEEIWEKWWNKELGRPLFQVTVPPPPETLVPVNKHLHRFLPMYDFNIPAATIIRDILTDWQNEVSSCCDGGFPSAWINFGPGVLAALVGGEGRCGEDTVWFYPGRFAGREIGDISIRVDRETPWFRRLEEFFVTAAEQWHGQLHIGHTDIGGTLDVLNSLRPGETLIFDLFDSPDEVKRLTWEIHQAWFEIFDHFNALLPTDNHGCSAWAKLLSKRPHYMLQCDFAYMISPEQFAEFVLPELSAACRRIARPFYHLDGKGQLAHLDMLLSIPELLGIQWVPGDGAPDSSQWPEVYRRIAAADRLMQVFVNDVTVIEKVLEQTDKPELMLFSGYIPAGQEDQLMNVYRRFGVAPIYGDA